MTNLEQLGVFYLGRAHDLATGTTRDEPILYDAKDLTTHAVIVGMTGSGKTGLAIALLEEAALDGIPAIAIDPKGDLGNLLLAFPGLAADDFRPWIDPDAAARAGRTPDEQAAWTADLWRKGLADWGQDGARIGRFRDAVEIALYTPGSRAGIPLTVLRSFAAPASEVAADEDALRERVQTATSGLLALLGVEADPVRSREHILIATLLDRAWRAGDDYELASLIRGIQDPGIARVGVIDLESFFPARERFELAMRLNNLLAAPGFAPWMDGEPLDVGRLLYTPAGKPRLAIVSIAHLSDPERMFLVTLLLNEVLAWVRAQPGTQSLRAILYMDEVFGYFPPTANPPSKTPMLTLLKQARAYGLGVVLATQNPVDLDYKGLSNTGTWLLGRLQTERDKARVLEGLEGAAAGGAFDRAAMERTLAGLGNRVFLLQNVHEDAPVVFQTRWALSYLAGPLTREQIKRLAGTRTAATAAAPPTTTAAPPPISPEPSRAAAPAVDGRPVVPPGITETFLAARPAPASGAQLGYRPALIATATLRYVDARAGVDEPATVTLLAPLAGSAEPPWAEAAEVPAPACEQAPRAGAAFAPLPAPAADPKRYAAWRKSLPTHLARARPLALWQCPALKEVSRPGQSEGEFRVRLRERAHEARDRLLAEIRARYAPKLARLAERRRDAEGRVEREQSQYRQSQAQAAISVGATVLGALFGRKVASAGTIGRATTAMRGAGRTMREREDVGRAAEKVEDLAQQLAALEADLEDDLERVRAEQDPERLALVPLAVPPRKSEIAVERLELAWTPWHRAADGTETPAF
jgi:hypothetical protein